MSARIFYKNVFNFLYVCVQSLHNLLQKNIIDDILLFNLFE